MHDYDDDDFRASLISESIEKNIVLSARSLCKDFERPNGSVSTVLEGIDLDIYDGEFLAIVGLSGTGKSVLLRCLAGLIKPDRGSIAYKRPGPENLQMRAFVFQNFSLYPWLTVRENVEMSLLKLSKEEQKARIDNMLNLVGLTGQQESYPKELSGGMKQRVSLARAMVADPMILFMDEPFASLDPLTTETLKSEVVKLWTQKNKKTRACVLVTHSFTEALQFADRIIIMQSNPGKIFKVIELKMPVPRNQNSTTYKEAEKYLETVFTDMHLGKFRSIHYDTSVFSEVVEHKTTMGKEEKVKTSTKVENTLSFLTNSVSLVDISFYLVEGLVRLLEKIEKPIDIYELCEQMGQNLNHIVPVLKACLSIKVITVEGTIVNLTETGKQLALTEDTQERLELVKSAILNVPIIRSIFTHLDKLPKNESEGLSRSVIDGYISIMLPFEDYEAQFKAILRWGRYCNLFNYDESKDLFYLVEPPKQVDSLKF